MKIFLKVVLLVSILSLVGLSGCAASTAKKAQIISDELKKRYNEDFVVDSIAGAGSDQSLKGYSKVYCYLAKDKNKRFRALVSNDNKIIRDGYMGIIMSPKLEIAIHDIAKKYYEEVNVKADISLIWEEFPKKVLNDKNITIGEYFSEGLSGGVAYVYVPSSESVDKEKMAETTYNIAKEILNLRCQDLGLSVCYVNHNAYKEVNEKYKDLRKTTDDFLDQFHKYFSDKSRSINYSSVNITFGKIEESVEQILSSIK